MRELNELFVGDGGLSREEALKVLGRVIEMGVDFKSRKQFYHPDRSLTPQAIMVEPLPETGIPIEDVLEKLSLEYLPGMPNFGSSQFMGFPDAGNSLAGLSGAVLGEFLNVNLINSTFCSRIATEMEIAVIRWFREIVGYPASPPPTDGAQVGGMVLYGGTMSNYTAALIARERAFPGTLKTGIRFDPSKVRVVVPERIGHYTVAASLSWCGLGSENLLRAPIREFRYDQPALRQLLVDARRRGERVIMLVAYAGDSRTMTVDDLVGLHDLVRNESPETWLHCDGCHGTSLSFSPEHRKQLSGIGLWDSITLDPHKVLAVPYPLSLFLLRNPEDSRIITTESDLIMRQQNSLGQTTPVIGSKAFLSLRLWVLMKTHGVQGIAELIERRCALARKLAEKVENDERFLLLNHVAINSVVFIFVPPQFRGSMTRENADATSAINRMIYEHLMAEGRYYLHSFVATDNMNRLGHGADFGVNVLRFMGGNALITDSMLDELLNYLAEVAEKYNSSTG